MDIYGRVCTFKGDSLSDCPFRYQGQYQDEETGLYYNRFRYYDPNVGNYISKDPIGLAGGNPTLYGYVHDTNGWVDRLGLRVNNPKELHAAIREKWEYTMTRQDMQEIQKTIDRIKVGDTTPYPLNDGTSYSNHWTKDPIDSITKERITGQRLNTSNTYTEWTVKTPNVSNRGARRIVVDRQTGRAYYSHDHYKNFVEIDLSGWH